MRARHTPVVLDKGTNGPHLSWTPPPHDPDHGPADQYRVLRADSPEGPFTVIDSIAGTAYDDSEDGTWFYEVLAVNSTGEASD